MKPEKLINFRIPNDLKEAFDSVCQETKQTRTHQLINLMRDYVDLESRRLDQQNQSVHHQISRSRNRYPDQAIRLRLYSLKSVVVISLTSLVPNFLIRPHFGLFRHQFIALKESMLLSPFFAATSSFLIIRIAKLVKMNSFSTGF